MPPKFNSNPNPALTSRDIYFTEIEEKIILFKSTVY